MLSRVADAVYWMSRYVERAENIARIIDVNLRLTLDATTARGNSWRPLVMIMADGKPFEAAYDGYTRRNVLQFLVFDPDYPNSILSCLTAARANARSVREVISSEMWEQLNTMHLTVREAARRPEVLEAPGDLLAGVRSASHQFAGITESTMAHGEAWHFCKVGTTLERADKTTRILDVKYFMLLPAAADVGTTRDLVQWSALLRSASAWESYIKRHHVIAPAAIAEFLLLDREFPRAVYHCLSTADYSLHAVSRTPQGSYANETERRLGILRAELSYARIDEIVAGGLHEYLDNLQERLNAVGSSLYDTFFR